MSEPRIRVTLVEGLTVLGICFLLLAVYATWFGRAQSAAPKPQGFALFFSDPKRQPVWQEGRRFQWAWGGLRQGG